MALDAWAGFLDPVDAPSWLLALLAPDALGGVPVGVVLAYLGAPLGLAGVAVLTRRAAGHAATLLAAVGVTGLFAFWVGYPDLATLGGLGSIVLGWALILWPAPVALASPLWVAAGVLGLPELVPPAVRWGPVTNFTVTAAAVGATGALLLVQRRTGVTATGPGSRDGASGEAERGLDELAETFGEPGS
jgi:hypothetical protein